MALIDYVERPCPWCGEPCLLAVDCTTGDQRYIEDCQVCCRPMVVSITLAPDGQPTTVELEAEEQ